ncbi:MAG: hypothetical protein Q8K43_12100, partial [Sulfurimicrobium sp.]|nr:hypothetical protein [Sulfurimicrobium sp.]
TGPLPWQYAQWLIREIGVKRLQKRCSGFLVIGSLGCLLLICAASSIANVAESFLDGDENEILETVHWSVVTCCVI